MSAFQSLLAQIAQPELDPLEMTGFEYTAWLLARVTSC